jgi:TonB family protein
MNRKYILLFCFLFLTTGLFSSNKGGYVLLDRMVVAFNEMSGAGEIGESKINFALNGMMSEARKAKAQEKVDRYFYERYTKILRILKLAVIYDPEGILLNLLRKESVEFIGEVKGEDFYRGKEDNLITLLAEVITEEISNLKGYLDGRNKKVSSKYIKEDRIQLSPGRKPVLIHEVNFEYPNSAIRARIQGKLVLEVRIDKKGNVTDVEVISGHPLLNKEAVKAVKQYKYKPYIKNGNPRSVVFRETIRFIIRN